VPDQVEDAADQLKPHAAVTAGDAGDRVEPHAAAAIVDIFVYVVVLNLFIEYLPQVLSETFTLSLLGRPAQGRSGDRRGVALVVVSPRSRWATTIAALSVLRSMIAVAGTYVSEATSG